MRPHRPNFRWTRAAPCSRSVESDEHHLRTRRTHPGRVPTWLRVLIPTVLILVWFARSAPAGRRSAPSATSVENEQAQFLPASAEATEVQELQAEFRLRGRDPAIVVYATDDGLSDAARRRRCARRRRLLPGLEGVVADGVSPPVVSDDGEAAEVFVQVDAPHARSTTSSRRCATHRQTAATASGRRHRSGGLHRRPHRRVRGHRRAAAPRRLRRGVRDPRRSCTGRRCCR